MAFRCDSLCIFDEIPAAVYVLQADRFAAYNHATVTLLGQPGERLAGANYWDLCPPWIRDEVRERGRAWINGAPMDPHSVCPVVDDRGEQKWIEVFRRRIEFRRANALLITALDMAEHRAWMESSLSLMAHHGMLPFTDAPRNLDDQRPRANGIKALTGRQRQVLDLIQCGRSNKQIARELGITEGTTKLHVFNLMRIFNAPNRTSLALAARERRF